ncbi:MAG: hypothetical protein EA377_02365 [Phycisphaerales bacterium]|nr:MAG: hypothetical protein EA377_02365 [Phycisphaerales bacterium]
MFRRAIEKWRCRCRSSVSGPMKADEQALGGTSGRRGRAVASSLREAVEDRRPHLAKQLARAASRGAARSPNAAFELAVWHLENDRPGEAVHCVEGCAFMTDSLRLLRAIALLRDGREFDARFDLLSWARRSSAPQQARRLSALLEASDDPAHAINTLQKDLQQTDDPTSLLILLLIKAGEFQSDDQHLEDLSERICRAASWRALNFDLSAVLESLDFPLLEVPSTPSAADSEALALELLASPQLIPVLVAAQREQPDEATNQLLSAALESALPEMEQPSVGYAALAELAEVAGRPELAARWVARGLRLFPANPQLRALADAMGKTDEHGAEVIAAIAPDSSAPDESRRAAA